MKTFEARLDTLSKIITGLMGPIFLIWPWYLIISLRSQPDQNYLPHLIVLGILLIVLFIACYIYWPKNYQINNGELIVKRLISEKRFLLSDITKAEYVSKLQMGWALRILGNGGIFGYTGFFTNKTFGRMNWFVTDKDKMIVLALTNGKHIVVSPDDTEEFLKSLKGKK
jgi:hypothetical protein